MGKLSEKKSLDTVIGKLPLVMKSGKFSFGYKECIKKLRKGEGKLVIVSQSYPQVEKSEIQYYCMLSKCVYYEFPGTNVDLGRSCGKYFRASVLTVTDPGESDIVTFLKEQTESTD